MPMFNKNPIRIDEERHVLSRRISRNFEVCHRKRMQETTFVWRQPATGKAAQHCNPFVHSQVSKSTTRPGNCRSHPFPSSLYYFAHESSDHLASSLSFSSCASQTHTIFLQGDNYATSLKRKHDGLPFVCLD